MTSRIFTEPTKPVVGRMFTICFDFEYYADTSVTLDLDWAPSHTPTSVELTEESPCHNVLSASDTVSLYISCATDSLTVSFQL